MINSSYTLPCGLVLSNRICKSAMTESLAGADFLPNEQHQELYRRWGESGAGLMITGNVMIDEYHLERPGNVVLCDARKDLFVQRWREVVNAGTRSGARMFMQISHPGRQCPTYIQTTPVAPSSCRLDFLGSYGVPRALNETEIFQYIERFAEVAFLAKEAGFHGVQLHGAHGYLISSFLSPLTNQRSDDWGGSAENRARFLLMIVRKIRQRVGSEFALSVKLNVRDFKKGGITLEESSSLMAQLGGEGVDLIELSGGNFEQPMLLGKYYEETADGPVSAETEYFAKDAELIRSQVKTPLMLTGGIRSFSSARELLKRNVCDLLGFARPFCLDPAFPLRLLSEPEGHLQQYDGLMFANVKNIRTGTGKPSTQQVLNVTANLAWYYQQVTRLAHGLSPKLDISVRRAFLSYLFDEHKKALRNRIRRQFKG